VEVLDHPQQYLYPSPEETDKGFWPAAAPSSGTGFSRRPPPSFSSGVDGGSPGGRRAHHAPTCRGPSPTTSRLRLRSHTQSTTAAAGRRRSRGAKGAVEGPVSPAAVPQPHLWPSPPPQPYLRPSMEPRAGEPIPRHGRTGGSSIRKEEVSTPEPPARPHPWSHPF
jgi:hypothetical protein